MNYHLIKPLLFCLKPETAHNLAIWVLKYHLFCSAKIKQYPSLHNRVCDIEFKNPLGMAAGFDKNGQVFANLFDFGFGFVEIGTITPKAQAGNPKPRIFRLEEDRAIINRLGFNNVGIDKFLQNIANKDLKAEQILGINIGKNKDQQDAIADYLFLLEKTYEKGNYITINISSPNTKNLRKLQEKQELEKLLKAIADKKSQLQKIHQKNIPIFLKIAPDINEEQQKEISDIALKYKISALIISNTTISRPDLTNKNKNQTGGLSGKPLASLSDQILKNIYNYSKGKIPLIACGGIFNANDVYRKIKLGASLVQIYSAFIYEGFELVEKIKEDLDRLLKEDGFDHISQVIGINNK